MLELFIAVVCIGGLMIKPKESMKNEVHEVTKEQFYKEQGWDK